MKVTAAQPSMIDEVEDRPVETVYHITLDPSRGRLGGDPMPPPLTDMMLDVLADLRLAIKGRQTTPPPLPAAPPRTATARPSTPRPKGVCVRCKSDAWVPNGRGWRCSKCLPEPP